MAPVDLDWRKQAGQGGARLHGARDRHMIAPLRAESDRLGRVEIGGDEEQPGSKVAEIVGAAVLRKMLRQPMADAGVVEHAGGQGARQSREGFEKAAAEGIGEIMLRRLRQQCRKGDHAPGVFAQRRR
jgi:hypothetical protein